MMNRKHVGIVDTPSRTRYCYGSREDVSLQHVAIVLIGVFGSGPCEAAVIGHAHLMIKKNDGMRIKRRVRGILQSYVCSKSSTLIIRY
jgi:hypothetical protein